MENSVFFSLDKPVINQIKTMSQQIAGELEKWARGYSVVKKRWVAPLAFKLAALGNLFSHKDLCLAGKLHLWLCACENLLKEEKISTSLFLQRIEQFYALTTKQKTSSGSSHETGIIIIEIREHLEGYPLFALKGNQWSLKVKNLCYALLKNSCYEEDYRKEKVLPSGPEWLENGSIASGFPLMIFTLRMFEGQDFVENPFAENIITWASRSIKLLENLSDYTPEKEPRNFDYIFLSEKELSRSHAPNPGLQACKRTMEKALYYMDLARRGMYEFDSVSPILRNGMGTLLDLSYAFYVRGMKRDLSLEKLSLLLDG